MSQPKLCSVQPNHIPEIVALTQSLGLSHWSLDDYYSELDRSESIFEVALDRNDQVLGFVLGRVQTSGKAESSSAELLNIGVKIDAQRTGIGSRLLKHFLTMCRQEGTGEVFLEVRSLNLSARHFYSTFGFEEIGIRRGYYQDPSDDAILMKSTIAETQNFKI